MKVCLLGAENDALAGAKVGGIGDVLRDLPRALAAEGAEVTVLLPSYGKLHRLPGAERIGVCTTRFRGLPTRVEAYRVPHAYGADATGARAAACVLHHPDFVACAAPVAASGDDVPIYCDDGTERPFASDASKFALFCAGVLDAIVAGAIDRPDALHLHDWHASLAAILRAYDPHYASLRDLPLVYSIHNLALQGIRPFADDRSSLEAWFPHLDYDAATARDPRWKECVNPVAAAIRLADKVHTVSPTYAREIQRPNDVAAGLHGGEGLETDLRDAHTEGRLSGILNGIVYPASGTGAGDDGGASGATRNMTWPAFTSAFADGVLATLGAAAAPLRAVDYVAHQRALAWRERERPAHLLTSVGRLVEQKVAILLAPLEDGRPALAHLLERHADDACLVLVGSGDPALEASCADLAARHPNFLFANRYAQPLADLAFAHGDLFLMPSSFEPCGISQMLAMRAGQPCLVHAVGGLADTVDDGVDGFSFRGDTLIGQARAMIDRTDAVLADRSRSPDDWQALVRAASERRFDWAQSARRYLTELYR